MAYPSPVGVTSKAFAWALGTPYGPPPVLTHTGAMTT